MFAGSGNFIEDAVDVSLLYFCIIEVGVFVLGLVDVSTGYDVHVSVDVGEDVAGGG